MSEPDWIPTYGDKAALHRDPGMTEPDDNGRAAVIGAGLSVDQAHRRAAQQLANQGRELEEKEVVARGEAVTLEDDAVRIEDQLEDLPAGDPQIPALRHRVEALRRQAAQRFEQARSFGEQAEKCAHAVDRYSRASLEEIREAMNTRVVYSEPLLRSLNLPYEKETLDAAARGEFIDPWTGEPRDDMKIAPSLRRRSASTEMPAATGWGPHSDSHSTSQPSVDPSARRRGVVGAVREYIIQPAVTAIQSWKQDRRNPPRQSDPPRMK